MKALRKSISQKWVPKVKAEEHKAQLESSIEVKEVSSQQQEEEQVVGKKHKHQPKKKKEKKEKAVCAICYDESSRCNFALKCKHEFHWECLEAQLKAKWSGVRVSLNYMNCAVCRAPVSDSKGSRLKPYVDEFEALKVSLVTLANERAKEDDIDCKGLEGQERLDFLFKTLAFYQCVDCKQAYCGGLVSCAEELEIDAEQLRCQSCTFSRINQEQKEANPEAPAADAAAAVKRLADGSPDLRCLDHGYKHAVFKCDSCCSMATYDCIWNHYCDRCHGQAYQAKNYPCVGEDKCPLGIKHPPNQEAKHGGAANAPVPFVLGCLKCIGLDTENQSWGSNPHAF
eukprot:TRINITY_DN5977_c0_g1_i1.p1 TRINITY_DN5977_c0_g1~~TRINITY_DN5977_c0_g1_i1.p1  ORF type:complete len:341 (-),score=75.81 TRINITY_DN5977_c0_g1_i1:73-1095(-)